MKKMKLTVSKKISEKYSVVCVVVKDINNMTAKSRDIILRLEKLKKKKKIPNLNPFVNYFNVFSTENDIDGFYVNLDSIYGDINFDFLEDKKPFLPLGEKNIVFCEKEEILFDGHSVTHRMENWQIGERMRITGGSQNVMVVFVVPRGKDKGTQQIAGGFASEGQRLFGGAWKCYFDEQIEIDYESKVLDANLDVISDLENFGKLTSRGDKGIKKRRGESLGFVNKKSLIAVLNDELLASLKGLYPSATFENRLILSTSPNCKFGHFSTNIAFELSKSLGENVVTLAEDLAVKLRSETRVSSYFSKIEAAKNGFVNFFISDDYLLKFLDDFESILKYDVGEGRVILIESPSANPNKAMHVGHLRNVFLAQSLRAIYEKLGFKVFNDNIINDKGLPICKAMWALKEYGSDFSPGKDGIKPDHFVDKYYVLGAQKFKESKEVENQIRELLLKWENGDAETISLWKKMVSWVLDGHKETMERLGEEMGHMWFESEVYEVGKEIINEHLGKDSIVKTPDGAVIARLEDEYGVPDVVLLKSDGTSLYHTQDLGLTKLKIEKFNPWKAIWVVGNEQITHFQRLFSLIDSIGLLPIDNLYHLAYGYVFDKNGKKMSSRGGEVLSGDELLDMIQKAAGDEGVALCSLKYAFLSSDPFKDMKFDLEKAVLFTGKSGPYVMYAYARACSILKNVGDINLDFTSFEISDLNREILIKCADYPNIIISCANNYSPSILADYLYDLAKLFSQMYETEKVLDAKDSEKAVRVFVIRLVKKILHDGLLLLRIKPLEKM